VIIEDPPLEAVNRPNISQGSVATLLKYAGIFSDDIIANLLVKELWKSVTKSNFCTNLSIYYIV